MSKTLVIILSETRASELTFDNFKKNVIDELNADLCLCIGTKPDYDYNNPYYELAKYRFTYDEPDDFADAFEYAFRILSENKPKYDCLPDTNALYGKLPGSQYDITYYGNSIHLGDCSDDSVVIYTNSFSDYARRNQIYGGKSDNVVVHQKHVVTYKKPLYWREFLKVKDQFLGGIKDEHHEHPGSAGILIFFRWVLLKNLLEHGLIDTYDRFIITRSDFIYQLPHPKLELMDETNIWIPDSEYSGGYTDRHAILSKHNIVPYLNILHNLVLRSNEYFMKMKHLCNWNLERLIKFHLQQNGVLHLVKEMPYIMYAVRNINGSTRWASGEYSDELKYYIKYPSEYAKSGYYKTEFAKSGLSIVDFYKRQLVGIPNRPRPIIKMMYN